MNKKRILLIIFALIITGYGCNIHEKANRFISGFSMDKSGFKHKVHAENEVECRLCHSGFQTSARAGMPGETSCAKCHDPGEEDTKKIMAGKMRDNGTFIIKKPAISEDVIFDHKNHVVDRGAECSVCHKDVEKSTRTGKQLMPSMETCFTCHASKKNDCAYCHTKITGPDYKPEDHRLNWMKFHGQKAEAVNYDMSKNQCSICHVEKTCINCHNERKPQNHTNFWRQEGHGKFVDINRETCATCHKTSYCLKCHAETTPRTHIGSWGGGQQSHCLSCHIEVEQADGCTLCHKAGAPAHVAAAPEKPAWHVEGMTCRQCHSPGMAEAPRHVDNGDDCNICHK